MLRHLPFCGTTPDKHLVQFFQSFLQLTHCPSRHDLITKANRSGPIPAGRFIDETHCFVVLSKNQPALESHIRNFKKSDPQSRQPTVAQPTTCPLSKLIPCLIGINDFWMQTSPCKYHPLPMSHLKQTLKSAIPSSQLESRQGTTLFPVESIPCLIGIWAVVWHCIGERFELRK